MRMVTTKLRWSVALPLSIMLFIGAFGSAAEPAPAKPTFALGRVKTNPVATKPALALGRVKVDPPVNSKPVGNTFRDQYPPFEWKGDGDKIGNSLYGEFVLVWKEIQSLTSSVNSLYSDNEKLKAQNAELTKRIETSQGQDQAYQQIIKQNAELTKRIDQLAQSHTVLRDQLADLKKGKEADPEAQKPAPDANFAAPPRVK